MIGAFHYVQSLCLLHALVYILLYF